MGLYESHTCPSLAHSPFSRDQREVEELLDAEVDEESPRIIDTVTRAFPYNQGWMLPSSQGNEKPIKGTLSHLLKISTLTKYLTRKTFGIVRPSCELAIKSKLRTELAPDLEI